MRRVLPAIVDYNKESEQDCHDQRAVWGQHTGQVVWHHRGRIGWCEEGEEESEQDCALLRAQGITCHRGLRLGERAGQQHQLAVWGPYGASRVASTVAVVWHQQSQGEGSLSTYATPLGSITIVRVQDVVWHL